MLKKWDPYGSKRADLRVVFGKTVDTALDVVSFGFVGYIAISLILYYL